jgi:hypothetical protein
MKTFLFFGENILFTLHLKKRKEISLKNQLKTIEKQRIAKTKSKNIIYPKQHTTTQ